MIESYYATKPSRSHLARFPRPSARPFYQDIAQQAERVLGVHEATGSKPVFLTIYADVLLRLATPSPTSCPVMGRQDPRLPRTNASRRNPCRPHLSCPGSSNAQSSKVLTTRLRVGISLRAHIIPNFRRGRLILGRVQPALTPCSGNQSRTALAYYHTIEMQMKILPPPPI